MKARQTAILPIQYLRGIAAMLVVWHHATSMNGGGENWGSSGVDIFFVISGFIMTWTTDNKDITPWKFLQLRIIRVVPMYWLVTFMAIAGYALLPSAFLSFQWDAPSLVKSLLFMPYQSLASPDHLWPVFVSGWTLNYEMFFYVVFAIALGLPQKWRPLNMLVMMAIATANAYFSAGVFTTHFLEFAAGMLIAQWYRSNQEDDFNLPPTFASIAFGFWMLTYIHSPWSLLIGASVIVLYALHPRFNVRITPLVKLGDASYSIYLTHLFTIGIVRAVCAYRVDPYPYLFACMVFSAAVGSLVYRYVEKPMTDWLHARVTRPQLGPA